MTELELSTAKLDVPDQRLTLSYIRIFRAIKKSISLPRKEETSVLYKQRVRHGMHSSFLFRRNYVTSMAKMRIPSRAHISLFTNYNPCRDIPGIFNVRGERTVVWERAKNDPIYFLRIKVIVVFVVMNLVTKNFSTVTLVRTLEDDSISETSAAKILWIYGNWEQIKQNVGVSQSAANRESDLQSITTRRILVHVRGSWWQNLETTGQCAVDTIIRWSSQEGWDWWGV